MQMNCGIKRNVLKKNADLLELDMTSHEINLNVVHKLIQAVIPANSSACCKGLILFTCDKKKIYEQSGILTTVSHLPPNIKCGYS